MHIDWLQHSVEATCPVCRTEGAKRAVLSTGHVVTGQPPIVLLRCPACDTGFLEDLTPPDYEMNVAGMLDYYVEQGAGIDLIVAPLLRLPSGKIRRCLEVGCSSGFALDFGSFAWGWEVLGVDPSPLAAAGAEALGFPVLETYFNADLDVGPEPFDLAICSEVLEHVVEPRTLLAAIRQRLAPGGILVLSTPNFALVRPEAERDALARALSPGFHMVLYSKSSLAQALQSAGFGAVHIEESTETLRAFAARSPETLEGLRPADPVALGALLRGYFAARAVSVAPASAFACGFAYRHFKECVNAGLYAEAEESRARLAGSYRDRFGSDFGLGSGEPNLEAGKSLPFNLPGAFFFSGILELNGAGRPARAAADFAAAVAVESRLQGRQYPIGLRDGESGELASQSRKHLPMALAATDPDRAVREIEALEQAPRGEGLPSDLLMQARAQTFIRLVNAGAYAAAGRLAPGVSLALNTLDTPDTLDAARQTTAESLDSRYCLAMLAFHQGRPQDAAELFARVHQLASGAAERAEIFWSARLHEGLSLRRAGQEAPAREAFTEVAQTADTPSHLAAAARALLAEARG